MVHHTINNSTASAPSASSKISHMVQRLFLKTRGIRRWKGITLWGWAAAILGTQLSCSVAPRSPAALAISVPGAGASVGDSGVDAGAPLSFTAPFGRSKARWISASWGDLPGWAQDDVSEAWAALLSSCTRLSPDALAVWSAPCAQARALAKPEPDAARLRAWLQEQFQPYRIEASDGRSDGLMTGYFEPLLEARRKPGGAYQTPLYAPPPNLAARQPWFSRAELETQESAQAALRGREIAYLADPLEALMLQIQGSGRLRLLDELDASGQPRWVRLAFAAHNGQPYQSVGRWLADQGYLNIEQATWPAIRAWAKLNAERVDEMLRANPRLVFFREQPLLDAGSGPLGAQGVPLTPGRSIAVDRDSIPLGTPVWIASTEPQAWTPPQAMALPRPLQRLVIAQDTGGAIQGAVRADFFWGWGEGVEQQAGRTRQPLRVWALWPKG